MVMGLLKVLIEFWVGGECYWKVSEVLAFGILWSLPGMYNHGNWRCARHCSCCNVGAMGFHNLVHFACKMISSTFYVSQCVAAVLRTVAHTLACKALGRVWTYVFFDRDFKIKYTIERQLSLQHRMLDRPWCPVDGPSFNMINVIKNMFCKQ